MVIQDPGRSRFFKLILQLIQSRISSFPHYNIPTFYHSIPIIPVSYNPILYTASPITCILIPHYGSEAHYSKYIRPIRKDRFTPFLHPCFSFFYFCAVHPLPLSVKYAPANYPGSDQRLIVHAQKWKASCRDQNRGAEPLDHKGEDPEGARLRDEGEGFKLVTIQIVAGHRVSLNWHGYKLSEWARFCLLGGVDFCVPYAPTWMGKQATSTWLDVLSL